MTTTDTSSPAYYRETFGVGASQAAELSSQTKPSSGQAPARDISSPSYFRETFGVSANEAQILSEQAKGIALNRGGGITSEAPVGSAPAAGAPRTAANALAEYQRLIADRASGKINAAQWADTGKARERALADMIANGGSTQVASPTVQQLTDMANAHDASPLNATLDQYFAPPAQAYGYKFPVAAGPVTDEMQVQDLQIKEAFYAERLPANLVASVGESIRSSITALANETPAQMRSRLDGNKSRLTAMWQKSGEGSFEANMGVVDQQLEQWCRNPTLRPVIEAAARYLGPLQIDQILQFAKHRATRR
ncbi:MAG: hypothetical protein ACLPV8_25470 [Steroidobacteraceae bacterium]